MKIRVKYYLNTIEEEIDLTDYGHDADVKFEDLTEDEQNEITDNLREGQIVGISVEDIKE